MIHHTSGLRSLHALFGIAGWRGDDSRTNEDLNRIIKDQKDLNFVPGDEFLYCNTGYMLMATIIEKVTDEPFPSWIKRSVFDPLGMKDTYAEDMYQRIVPNNATSYYMGNETLRAVECWGYVGSGNVHSTTSDLLNWYSNFYKPAKGWESAFKKMQRTTSFNNGMENNYAFGITLDAYLGRSRIQHGGSIGGFRAYGCVYPEEETSIVVLTNFSRGNAGGHAARIARVLWKDKYEKISNSGKVDIVNLSTSQLQQFEGSYWYPASKIARKVYLKDDTLRYFRSANSETTLVPIARNRFKMLNVSGDIFLSFENNSKDMELIFQESGSPPSRATRFEATDVTTAELNGYVGAYRSLELETIYKMQLKEGQLSAYNVRHGKIQLNRIAKDKFKSVVASITFEFYRNDNDEVTGLLISNGRARNVVFERIME